LYVRPSTALHGHDRPSRAECVPKLGPVRAAPKRRSGSINAPASGLPHDYAMTLTRVQIPSDQSMGDVGRSAVVDRLTIVARLLRLGASSAGLAMDPLRRRSRMSQAWIVRAGREDEYYERAIADHLIVLGWRRVGDLTAHAGWEDVHRIVKATYPDVTPFTLDSYTRQLYAFRAVMDIGDFVLLIKAKAPDINVGEIVGDYAYRPDLPGPHIRNVRWADKEVNRAEIGVDLFDTPALTAVHHIRKPDAQDRLRRIVGTPAPKVRKSPTRSPTAPAADAPPTKAETPPTSDAYQNLTKNLNHARNLTFAGTNLEELGVTRFEIGDIYRAAWVQAVAALDQWVRREIHERMLRLCETPGKERPERYRSFELTLSAHEDIAAGTISLRQALDDRLSRKLSISTYQDPEKIRQGFGHVIDTTHLWRSVAEVISEQGGGNRTLTAGAIETKLRNIVRRRNKIAHEYDEDPPNSSRKRRINHVETMRAIEFIDQVATAITVVLDEAPTNGQSRQGA
jgi:hypothetical protein